MDYKYFLANKEKLTEALEKAIYETLVKMENELEDIDWFSVKAK